MAAVPRAGRSRTPRRTRVGPLQITVASWYATERGVATLAEVARRLQRDPSTLFVAVERYRTLRPELFNLTALQDTGPLVRQLPSQATTTTTTTPQSS